MPRTVLITGARGFIGEHLIQQLLDSGDDVVCWRRSAVTLSSHEAPRKGVAWHDVDVVDFHAVDRAMRGAAFAAIYHCAGVANPSVAGGDAAEAHKANAVGTLNLLEAVRAHTPAATVLIPSSGYVYPVSPRPLSEDTKCAPDNAYGHSKLAQEVVAQHYAATHGLAVIIARTFNACGPGQSDAYVVGAIASKIARLEREGGDRISTGNLSHIRDFLDVRDVAAAYRLLVETPAAAGQIYNICSGVASTIAEVVEKFRRMATRQFEVVQNIKPDRRASDRRVLIGDSTKLRALGWTPAHTLDETLRDTLESWRQIGH